MLVVQKQILPSCAEYFTKAVGVGTSGNGAQGREELGPKSITLFSTESECVYHQNSHSQKDNQFSYWQSFLLSEVTANLLGEKGRGRENAFVITLDSVRTIPQYRVCSISIRGLEAAYFHTQRDIQLPDLRESLDAIEAPKMQLLLWISRHHGVPKDTLSSYIPTWDWTEAVLTLPKKIHGDLQKLQNQLQPSNWYSKILLICHRGDFR